MERICYRHTKQSGALSSRCNQSGENSTLQLSLGIKPFETSNGLLSMEGRGYPRPLLYVQRVGRVCVNSSGHSHTHANPWMLEGLFCSDSLLSIGL